MKYEIMFIVKPDLESGALKDTVASFEKVLTSNGAKVLSSKDMGQKELAYDIKKYKSGYYYIYQIEAHDVKAINEFDRLALLNENMIRHMIIKLED
jgi:small subunit ribosomal protein S6